MNKWPITPKLYAKLEAIHTKLHGGGGATATLVTTATDVWGGLVGNTGSLSLMVLPSNDNYSSPLVDEVKVKKYFCSECGVLNDTWCERCMRCNACQPYCADSLPIAATTVRN